MVAESRQQAAAHAWHAILERTLKDNDVKLVTYVPDRVLTPLIAAIHGDAFFYGVRHRPRGGGGPLVCRTMRPELQALALDSHTITRIDELEFIADRSSKQAVMTQSPVALILSPLLTGGKVFQS
jgi:hypothetical protein